MSLLEVDSVNLAFGGRTILRDIYLRCGTGDLVGLIGRNGAGKSSLMKIIFGSLKGENQSVRVDGKYYQQLFTSKGMVHYLPQDGFAMDYLSLEQLMKAFEVAPYQEKIFELDGLFSQRKEPLRTVSGGLRKLIEVIVLLYAPAKFVLLDEPFSYLSPVLVEKLIPHIESQASHKGIVLSDHHYQTVLDTCNHHYILYDGILRKIYEAQELEQYGYIVKRS